MIVCGLPSVVACPPLIVETSASRPWYCSHDTTLVAWPLFEVPLSTSTVAPSACTRARDAARAAGMVNASFTAWRIGAILAVSE